MSEVGPVGRLGRWTATHFRLVVVAARDRPRLGVASVGNVGTGEVKDFTAIGDVVNTAARLQQCAEAGQLVMSDRMRATVQGPRPNATAVKLQLKGKAEPVEAWVVGPDPPAR